MIFISSVVDVGQLNRGIHEIGGQQASILLIKPLGLCLVLCPFDDQAFVRFHNVETALMDDVLHISSRLLAVGVDEL